MNISSLEIVIMAFLAGLCAGFSGLALIIARLTRDEYEDVREGADDGD